MNLDALIEAILFLEGDPIKINRLADILNKSEEDINDAVLILEQKLSDRGIKLVRKGNEIILATAPEASQICEKISKDEFNKDIGKAGLEVLAIATYKGPVSRADIDYIRGVNSSSAIRNLLVRGLLEKKSNPLDARGYVYSSSFRLLQFLGIGDAKDIPEYENFKNSINQFFNESKNELAR